jgi:hypothetical protein
VRSPDGVWTSFDAVGSADTEPVSINPAGEISGVYSDANQLEHGFLREPDGAITSFDVPDSSAGTFVTGMTPSGEITGYYDDYDEYPQPQRGFLRSRTTPGPSRDGSLTPTVGSTASCAVPTEEPKMSSNIKKGDRVGGEMF